MPYTPIVGTLGYVLSADQTKVLLVHRIAREGDDHFGKYNGLGGKMRPDEDVASCMRREIYEESGLEVVNMLLRCVINWTGFGPSGEDWLGFVYRIHAFTGTPKVRNEEGDLQWHPVTGLLALPMWEGDRLFLPMVFDDDPRVVYGHMPYDGDVCQGWTWERV